MGRFFNSFGEPSSNFEMSIMDGIESKHFEDSISII